jgi:very-short-patch-repair endonuclease
VSAREKIKARMGAVQSPIEAMLALHLYAEHMPLAQRQYRAIPDRNFRIDFAWPHLKFAVEVDGEVHRIKGRFHADLEKHALLVLAGWTLLRVGGREVRSGLAVRWVIQAYSMLETRAALTEATV